MTAREAVPPLGTGQPGLLLNFALTSTYIIPPTLDQGPGSQVYLTLTFSSLSTPSAFPRWLGRGLLGHRDTHSPTAPKLAEWVEDTILEKPGGTVGRRPVPGPLPVQVLWGGAAVTLVLRAPPTQTGTEREEGEGWW